MTSAPSASADHPILAGLNPQQRLAVETTEGAVLMLAGAGTGKTRALTARLAWLLASGQAMPGQVLAVTFTNRAAREMIHRVEGLLGHSAAGWWLGTFHALAARMLRRQAELVGLQSNFSIIDTDDSLRLIKQLMTAENLDQKATPPRALFTLISDWKDRALTPEAVPGSEGADLAGGKAIALYAQYQERLRQLNACDFGDLLLHCLTIFRAGGEPLAHWHRRFRYVLVDEYQDTNTAQYLWLRLLAQASGNLCVVGDDDQSIYGWRGADVGNILRFSREFPDVTTIRLEQNYRSTGHILAAANGVIANNETRLGKQLWTAEGDGHRVQVHGLWDQDAEARHIVREIEDQTGWPSGAGHLSLDDVAILVRTGNQMRAFEERLNTVGMPYRVVGGPRFYERAEIRDALAYLRVTVQPNDDLALERIINTPKRAIGPGALAQLQHLARAEGVSLHEACLRFIDRAEGRPQVRRNLSDLMKGFQRWRDALQGGDRPPSAPEGSVLSLDAPPSPDRLSGPPHVRLAERILDESGYTEMWAKEKSPDAPGRLENLKELISALHEFDTLSAFLEHVALVTDGAEAQDGAKVTLMTLHGAKGLEFDLVFLPGWEEGLFPGQRTLEENGTAGLEEERRLAYVGITRARKQAVISWVANRLLRGSWMSCIPSRFIAELPEAHIVTSQASGLGAFSGARGVGAGGTPRWGELPVIDMEPAGGTVGYQPARRPGHAPVSSDADGTGYKVKKRPLTDGVFNRGDRVRSDKFGDGTIIAVEGTMVQVEFDDGPTRKLVDRFLERLDG